MKKIQNLIRHLRDLSLCIQILGFKLGHRYWYLGILCKRDPSFMLHWADQCEQEANRCLIRGEEDKAKCLYGWTEMLRIGYIANNKVIIDKAIIASQNNIIHREDMGYGMESYY